MPDADVPGDAPDGEPYGCDPDELPPAGFEPVEPLPPTTAAPPDTDGVGVTWALAVATGVETVGVRTVGVCTVGVGTGGGVGVVGTGAGGFGGGGSGAGAGGVVGTGTLTDGTETVGTEIVGVGTGTWPSAADAASPPRAHATPTIAAVFTFV